MAQMTILTENEFIAWFAPERDVDGGYFVQRYWDVPTDEQIITRARAERRLWTYVNDGVGNASPVQGDHFVNREFYIICALPYDDGETIDVIGDIEFCTVCGQRFADEAQPGDTDAVTRSLDDEWTCVPCVNLR